MTSECDHHIMINRSSWIHFIFHSCSFFFNEIWNAVKLTISTEISQNISAITGSICHYNPTLTEAQHVHVLTKTHTHTHIHTNTLLHAITTSQSPSATFQSAFILMSKQPSCLPPRWIAITNPFGLGYHQLALAPNPIPPFPQAPTLSLAQSQTAIICYWQKRKNIISSYREVQ